MIRHVASDVEGGVVDGKTWGYWGSPTCLQIKLVLYEVYIRCYVMDVDRKYERNHGVSVEVVRYSCVRAYV